MKKSESKFNKTTEQKAPTKNIARTESNRGVSMVTNPQPSSPDNNAPAENEVIAPTQSVPQADKPAPVIAATTVPTESEAQLNNSEENFEQFSSEEEESLEELSEDVKEEPGVIQNISLLINPDRDPDPTWDIHDEKEAPLRKGELGFVTDDLDVSSVEVADIEVTILQVKEEIEDKVSVEADEESKASFPLASWKISLSESSESTKIEIDRSEMIREIRELKKLIDERRVHNFLLQAAMATFYMENKMDKAVILPEEDEEAPAAIEKYLDKLLYCCERKYSFVTYSTNFEETHTEKVRIKKEKNRILDDEIVKMIARERSIATGLLSSRTGNILPDKVIDRLIKRQYQSMYTLTQWRIKFLKIRDRVNIMDAKVRAIECIGEGLRLSDYEDMMLESNNSMEKIEEKEEELLNLRRRCNEATQMLAHMREKQFAVEGDIVTGKKNVEKLKGQVGDLRVRITEFRKAKVHTRYCIEKIRERNALLFKRPLLCDFAACVDKEKAMRVELRTLKQTFDEGRKTLKHLRATLTNRRERSSGRSSTKTRKQNL